MRVNIPAIKALAFVLLVVAFVVASGCSDTESVRIVRDVPVTRVIPEGGSSASSGGGGFGGGGGGGDASFNSGSIYVSSVTPAGRAILRFRAADAATTSNIAPVNQIVGSNTQLADLAPDFQLDRFNDRLYVLDLTRVLVFDNVSSANGNVAPSRVIGLDKLIAPASIALDTSRDVLYVADFSANEIDVFNNVSTLNATPTANRVIGGGAGLDGPREIFIDVSADKLYIANSFSDSVATFDAASTATGSVDASRVLTGTQTQLSFPFGLATDSSGRLFVGNRGTGSITVYQPGASGNSAPLASFDQTQSGLAFPAQMVISDGTKLVVADDLAFAVRTYSALAVANGVGTPIRTITGSNTQLFFPVGVAFDPTR